MKETEQGILADLARLCGVLDHYYDIWGKRHETSPETQREILRAMRLRVDSPKDLEAEVRLREEAPLQRPCPPFVALTEGDGLDLSLVVPSGAEPSTKTLRVGGHVYELREISSEEVSGGRVRVRAMLTDPLALGLHDAEVTCAAPSSVVTARSRMAVNPRRGHEPDAVVQGKKLWGVALPLHGVRSARNWGIGDFADLFGVVEWAAGLGADMVGVLPLHALFNSAPYGVSPYYPSSRLFLNPIHIAVDPMAEASDASVASLLESPETQAELDRLRTSEWVEHEPVWGLKRRALELCYTAFLRDHLAAPSGPSQRGRAFEAWRREQGAALDRFATFCALRDHLAKEGSDPPPWPEWPEKLRTPESPGTREFRETRPREVEFHCYLQWVAEEQLARAGQAAKEHGMVVGLYLDLALGVDPCGADAWVYQDTLALGASAGAPPDPFSLLGQRWGVPPAIPERHRETGYELFLETVRRNARRAGALRIDHALALWRLFWIPGALPPSQGAYVEERADELLGLLRLVSREERCLIVGEDLGTVPDEVKEALMESGFYSYRLLIFEKDRDALYRRPDFYPRQALVSIATHDLPTLDGFWLGRDIEVKRELGRYPDAQSEMGDAEERSKDRLRLLEAIQAEGLLPEGMKPSPHPPHGRLDELAEAVHGFLARTPSALMLVNVDDLLGETEMQNLPGTLDEYPNWRRKCALPLECWGESDRANRIARAIAREGRGKGP